MKNSQLLELLELYMDMVDKQDEIIHRLGKIVARQATDLQLLKNDSLFFSREPDFGALEAKNVMEEYEKMKDVGEE